LQPMTNAGHWSYRWCIPKYFRWLKKKNVRTNYFYSSQ